MTTVAGIHLGPDTHANRPAATGPTAGSLYYCSDHDLIYITDGTTWSTWADVGGGGGGGGTVETGTLVYSDPLTDTTELTVDTGSATYDAGEGGVDVAANSRIRWDQAAVDMATLGDKWEARIDLKPAGVGIYDFLSMYDTSGWDAVLHRVEARSGNRDNGIFTVASGGGPTSQGGEFTKSFIYRATDDPDWLRIGWGVSNRVFFVRYWLLDRPVNAGWGTVSTTTYTTGDLGLYVENFADCWIRNLDVYTYA